MRRTLFLLLFLVCATARAELRVVIDTAEPERVLAIAERLAMREEVPAADWDALFATAGYRDLKQREAAMKRPFTDDEFRAFVTSPAVMDNREALRKTLDSWRRFDAEAAARRAMRYLPAGTAATATVYPLIKPKPNSFVFRTDHGMAIFLYLDPKVTRAQFENIAVHELHHIGYDAACPDPKERTPAALTRLYLGGFGEGLAVLAAAGSPRTHPHVTSGAGERATWDRDVAKVAADIPRMEAFFESILDGRLADTAAITPEFMKFISTEDVPQGAFYTVGWTMASAIEREKGREALVAMICDPLKLLIEYNAIAKRRALPSWSEAFVDRLAASCNGGCGERQMR